MALIREYLEDTNEGRTNLIARIKSWQSTTPQDKLMKEDTIDLLQNPNNRHRRHLELNPGKYNYNPNKYKQIKNSPIKKNNNLFHLQALA